jgi:UDP-glucose 4-epimerase
MQRYFVTGCAGFIGSNLVDRLLVDGHEVVGYDNFSTGRPQFIAKARQSAAFSFVEGDLLDTDALLGAMRRNPIDRVFHLAANADISRGLERPRRDLEQNTIATYNVLNAMREVGTREIVFSSTGSVYGEPEVFPTPEDAPFPIQTSFYAASKVAGEGLIQAFCEGFGFRCWIYRFVSVLGERYTHGHVFDFYGKLAADPTRIDVLGNGAQTKSYMYVGDCIDGLLLGTERARAKVNIFNLGSDETIQIDRSLALIAGHLGLAPAVSHAGGERGWVGDSPLIHLDCSRIRALGWQPRVSIADGVLATLDWLVENRWVYGEAA